MVWSGRWNPIEKAAAGRARWMQQSKARTDAKVAAEREEARKRAQKRIDERKAIRKVRHERTDKARRAQQLQAPQFVGAGGWRRVTPYATPTTEERKEEAAATILEAEARKAEDQNWVTEFTPQQEQQIAGDETSIQRVKSGVINGDIGLEDGGAMIQALNQRIGSVQKIRRPRRKDEPWYEPGPDGEPRGVGDSWGEEGGLVTRDPDGKKRILFRPDQMPQAQREKAQLALEEKQRLTEEKHALLIEKYMRDIRMKDVEETVKDAKGEESVKKRPPTNEEVFGKIQELFPNDFPAPSFRQQAPPPVFGEMPRGGGPITDAEFGKLPEGASYRHADGTIRRKESQKKSRRVSRSADHFPSLVGF